jgi:hypothetical protein
MTRAAFLKSRPLLVVALLLGGCISLIRPVLADGTRPGTTFRNTAGATFTDDTNTRYDATSNTVIIRVAEVAGITVTAQPPTNIAPNGGDTLSVDFIVTNTGNDPTLFSLPEFASFTAITGPAPTQNGLLQIVAIDGQVVPAQNIPAGGLITRVIPPNPGNGSRVGTVTVRVPVRVNPNSATGDRFTVSLGNTAPPNGQNQDSAPSPTDVATQDGPDGTPTDDEADGPPINGVREAMDTSAVIATNARLQAYATLLKAISSYSNSSTTETFADDILTYRLALRVLNPSPPDTGIVNSNLFGTAISVNGNRVSRVLVSDAIPGNTQLATILPLVPTGWTVVYTTSPLATPAQDALWATARPANRITRIGFVIDAGTTGLDRTAEQPITGFEFAVTPLADFSGGEIANISQVFGQSQPPPTGPNGALPEPAPGTPTQLVYDESGDQTPNNGLGNNNPDSNPGGFSPDGDGGINDGQANPDANGRDPNSIGDPTGNTNQGNPEDIDGGEATVYVLATTPLNGPQNAPGAVGPTNNNDDFTNKSILLPAGRDPSTPLTDVETPVVSFTNTAQNTNNTIQTLSLLPTPPATLGDLPSGTRVTITAGTDVAEYEYNGATFTWVSGTNTSPTDPVKLVNLAPNDRASGGPDEASYTVDVNLPGANQFTGFPVPITTFIDADLNGVFNSEPSNITIDRVYTGFLRLDKQARILNKAGIEVAPFSTILPNNILGSGGFIEYRVSYTNISTTGGTGSIVLNVDGLVITEDGTIGGSTGNNWALDNGNEDRDNNPVTGIDTSHVSGHVAGQGTVSTNPTGITTFFSGLGGAAPATDATTGTTVTTDVTRYIHTVPQVTPGQTGFFTFRRKVN